ncbi:MAG: hypothetical protein KIT83_17750 [Bryobacterales bacterium]|nr:hypothetical protein [Bryobacterales bacterium]
MMRNPKTLNVLIIAIVAIALAYMAKPSSDCTGSVVFAEPMPLPTAAPPAKSSLPKELVVYYFHTTARCYTCKLIEDYSADIIKQHFADDLNRGRIEWRAVNVQEPSNRHYIQKFQLYTKSVVLLRLHNGQEIKHKVLNDTWNLVGNRKAFESYVVQEVRAIMGGS